MWFGKEVQELLWEERIAPIFRTFYKILKNGDKIRLSPKLE